MCGRKVGRIVHPNTIYDHQRIPQRMMPSIPDWIIEAAGAIQLQRRAGTVKSILHRSLATMKEFLDD